MTTWDPNADPQALAWQRRVDASVARDPSLADAGTLPVASPLYGQLGLELQQAPSGKAYTAAASAGQTGPTIAGGGPGSAPPAKANPMGAPTGGGKISQADLSKWADEQLARARAMATGPSAVKGSLDASRAEQPSWLAGNPNNVDPGATRGQTHPQAMMNALHPYAYNYKPGAVPGEDPSKTNYGVMAQDLEKTPMGKSLVEDTPGGKMIDVPKATGALLAANADLQQQINEMRKYGGK